MILLQNGPRLEVNMIMLLQDGPNLDGDDLHHAVRS